MAKAPWEATASDPDLTALGSGLRTSGGLKRYGRIAAWLAGIGLATVLLAFYLPLSQAHGELLEQHRELNGKAKQLEQQLLGARTELRAAEGRRDELEQTEKQRQSRTQAQKQRAEATSAALSAVAGKHAKKGAVIGSAPGAVVVALPDTLVFVPRKLDVTPEGQRLLCELHKAASGRALGVSAPADAKAMIPQLKAKFDDAWVMGAARAASVAEALESKCGVPRAKLRATAAGAPSFEGAKPPAAHVAIAVELEPVE